MGRVSVKENKNMYQLKREAGLAPDPEAAFARADWASVPFE